MLRKRIWVAVCVLAAGTAVGAQSEAAREVQRRANGAERVVVAQVTAVQPQYQRNEHGDMLIVTRATLRVEETLKGVSVGAGALEVDVEGGTVGGVTLQVSDMPAVVPGDAAVFFLTRSGQGRTIPYDRGRDVLKLDGENRVRGTALTLADVRQAVGGGR